jgi:hypothetical protein
VFYRKEDKKDSGWFKKRNEKINFLFLFLPCKENIRDIIKMVGSWDFLWLCLTGWDPPLGRHEDGAPIRSSICVYFPSRIIIIIFIWVAYLAMLV